MLSGLIDLPWWGYVIYTLIVTHITIAGVTVFLHRHQAHRALDMHPIPSHFFRFWLWLTTGMVTKDWAAIHRKHHARCETAADPHSPQVLGLKKVFLEGAELYRAEAKNAETLEKFGHGTPDDWLERHVYSGRSAHGIVLQLIINVTLFGAVGLTIWAVQMAWIPLFAAGVINGVGHYWGYRNFQCEDASTNILPWGILIGGEELHNNHHSYPSSARLSNKWYEFDIGWMYIRILEMLGLAKVKKVAPQVRLIRAKPECDNDTLQAVITHRYDVLTSYARSIRQVCRDELDKLASSASARKLPRWITSDAEDLREQERHQLYEVLQHSKVLATIYSMRKELAAIWERSSATTEQLLKQLDDWCKRADASGIPPLQELSLRLRSYA